MNQSEKSVVTFATYDRFSISKLGRAPYWFIEFRAYHITKVLFSEFGVKI